MSTISTFRRRLDAERVKAARKVAPKIYGEHLKRANFRRLWREGLKQRAEMESAGLKPFGK